MGHANTIFRQLVDFLPHDRFEGFVGQQKGDRYVKHFTCWQQLLCLLYAQSTGKTSLRDIEVGLRCQQKTWYHLGMTGISKSNLARANEKRSYLIFEQLFYVLLSQFRSVLPNKAQLGMDARVYSIDSTVVDLCLSLFSWAKFRVAKGAIKIHTRYDVVSQIPDLLMITEGTVHDSTQARFLTNDLSRDSIVIVDRAYVDYTWWKDLEERDITFVIRAKKNIQVVSVERAALSGEQGVLSDELIELVLPEAEKKYPYRLRRITYYDEETKRTLVFLTNNRAYSAGTIAALYKARWSIELFFKWIKQHLKIKTFLGTSKNAVMTQIWVAMIYYLLLAYLKLQTKFKGSLLDLTRMIAETLLLRIPLLHIISLSITTITKARALDSPQISWC